MVKHDDYMTPFSAWRDVSPPSPPLWEAFTGDGIRAHGELGFDVIHEDVDFFTHDLDECVVPTHPSVSFPESSRACELGKPFVAIMPWRR